MINDAAYFTHALARLVCFVTKVRKMDVYEADPDTQDRNLAQAGGVSLGQSARKLQQRRTLGLWIHSGTQQC